MTKKVAVIGAGSWGTTLANLAAGNDRRVTLWARDPTLARAMARDRRNVRYLPAFPLADSIAPTSDIMEAVTGAELIVCAAPSHAMREVLEQTVPYVDPATIVVSASKGIENDTLKRMTEVLAEVLGGQERLAVLSGPSFAVEVSRGVPTAVTVAAHDDAVSRSVRDAFATSRFRIYTSTDVVGVELGGAVKNVIAIATGISDGLRYGDNARAALVTRGLAEISRLGIALGGDRLTFMGLAGLGDLVVTCTGELSRNRNVGLRLGRGETLDDILAEMTMVAEGVRTTRSVRDLASHYDVQMPITEEVHEILYHAKRPEVSVEELMTREFKPEFERR
jgi:glycerol-3-phosphate dehydrogenase (NAD(P)+)